MNILKPWGHDFRCLSQMCDVNASQHSPKGHHAPVDSFSPSLSPVSPPWRGGGGGAGWSMRHYVMFCWRINASHKLPRCAKSQWHCSAGAWEGGIRPRDCTPMNIPPRNISLIRSASPFLSGSAWAALQCLQLVCSHFSFSFSHIFTPFLNRVPTPLFLQTRYFYISAFATEKKSNVFVEHKDD